jgi:hypothetical protein
VGNDIFYISDDQDVFHQGQAVPLSSNTSMYRLFASRCNVP